MSLLSELSLSHILSLGGGEIRYFLWGGEGGELPPLPLDKNANYNCTLAIVSVIMELNHPYNIIQTCYRGINITDIFFRPSEGYPNKYTVVILWFVCELPDNWKDEFNRKSDFLDNGGSEQEEFMESDAL